MKRTDTTSTPQVSAVIASAPADATHTHRFPKAAQAQPPAPGGGGGGGGGGGASAASAGASFRISWLLLAIVCSVAIHAWRRFSRWRAARDAERKALQGEDSDDGDGDTRMTPEERIRQELRNAQMWRRRPECESSNPAFSSLIAERVFADDADSSEVSAMGGLAPHLVAKRAMGVRRTKSPPRGRLYDEHRRRFQQAWPLSEEESDGAQTSGDVTKEDEDQNGRWLGAPAQALADFEQRVVTQCM